MHDPYETGRAALSHGPAHAWLATVCLGVVVLLTLLDAIAGATSSLATR